MTKDEILNTYSMTDIVEGYGIHPDAHGLCKCPFHNDDRASLKIYDKDYHCFACGAHGDMFTFVEKMSNVSFREAFQMLGGTYEKSSSRETRERVAKAKAERERKEREQEQARELKHRNNMMISAYRACLDEAEPGDDLWCYCINGLQYQLYLHGELNGMTY
ncbi:MAG: CHC2 zinc finger domain-containing protein [Bacteroidales bacterium]|nr:CHC2 zinc finger domain-containing protein [Bacteroidales bacterium]